MSVFKVKKSPEMIKILFIGESWMGSCARSLKEALVRGGRLDLDEIAEDAFFPKARALFPNAHIMTCSGADLNYKISVSDRSSLGVGLFVGMYGKDSWLGLPGASVISCWILSIKAFFSCAVINAGSKLFLPIVQMAGYMAFRIDGRFVAGYMGGFGMVVAPCFRWLLC